MTCPLSHSQKANLEVQWDCKQRSELVLVMRSMNLFQRRLKLQTALLDSQTDVNLCQIVIDAVQAAAVLVS